MTTPEGRQQAQPLEAGESTGNVEARPAWLVELGQHIRETSELIREGNRRIRESQEETARQLRESREARDQEFRERRKKLDREARERRKKLDREARERQEKRDKEARERQQEADRRFRETERRLKKAEDLFAVQWGKLMESLVKGDLLKLLDGRGIDVTSLAQRTLHRRGGESYEVDILAVNGREVVVVEVKTTLRPEDVGRFRSKLGRFKDWWKEYADRKVYGAMAYLEASDDVVTHAERQGFFVIRATGSSSSIVNAEDFKPRVFA